MKIVGFGICIFALVKVHRNRTEVKNQDHFENYDVLFQRID